MPATTDSKFLAERLIARLSPLRRANLERRIREHLDNVRLARREDFDPLDALETRLASMLGRFSALTA